jgi:hypothetical protein
MFLKTRLGKFVLNLFIVLLSLSAFFLIFELFPSDQILDEIVLNNVKEENSNIFLYSTKSYDLTFLNNSDDLNDKSLNFFKAGNNSVRFIENERSFLYHKPILNASNYSLIMGDSVLCMVSPFFNDDTISDFYIIQAGGYSFNQIINSYYETIKENDFPKKMVYLITQNDFSKEQIIYTKSNIKYIYELRDYKLKIMPDFLLRIKYFKFINDLIVYSFYGSDYEFNSRLFEIDNSKYYLEFDKVIELNKKNNVETILINVPYHDSNFSNDLAVNLFLNKYESKNNSNNFLMFNLKDFLKHYNYSEMFIKNSSDLIHYNDKYNELIANEIEILIGSFE